MPTTEVKLKIIKRKTIILFILFFSISVFAEEIEIAPYHHMKNNKFRNPEGSPQRDPDKKFSYRTFNREKKKIEINIPKNHVISKEYVLNELEGYAQDDYITWIGHATFLIKLGDTTIITDPYFSKNAGPMIFGPKRYVNPAIDLGDLPEIDLYLLTHNHYDHLDYMTVKNFPYKDAKVLTPLGLSNYFTKHEFSNVEEMDWYNEIKINDIKITFLPAIHWSKRTLLDTNKTLWGSFLIEYKDIKLFFACDTGYGNIYKELGEKIGPIDISFINIGAYDFRPMFEKSIYHATPEEALNIGQDLRSKKVVGIHWGTVLLSLEDPFEPPVRFKKSANEYGFDESDAIIFKIGESMLLNELIAK